MTCYLCQKPIKPNHQLDWHHPEYKSQGGTEIEPTHHRCHVEFHSSKGDFKTWGHQGGLAAAATKRWAFNLLNVKHHPDYEEARWFYLMHYADAGWTAGLL